MKVLMILMLLPMLASAQTIQLKDDRIFYDGKIKYDVQPNMTELVQKAFTASDTEFTITENTGNGMFISGTTRLPTQYTHIRKLHFVMQLSPAGDALEYKIDSVKLTEKRRGSKWKTKSSKDLMEDFEPGKTSRTETERILNQIDLKFQQIIAIMKREAKK